MPAHGEVLPEGVFRRPDRDGLWARARINGQLRVQRLHSVATEEAAQERATWLKAEKARAAKALKAAQKVLAPKGPSLLWQDVEREAVEAFRASGRKDSTLERYLVSLVALEPFLKDRRVDLIDQKFLHGLIKLRRQPRVVVDENGRERGYPSPSNATINRDLTAMAMVLDHAAMEGLVEHNAARLFNRKKATKEVRDPKEIPEDQHVLALHNACSREFAPLLRFLAETGCRLTEAVCAVASDHHVNDPHPFGVLRHTKNAKARTIRYSPETAAWLRALPKALVPVALPGKTATGKQIHGVPLFWHGSPEDPHPFRNVSANIYDYGHRLQEKMPTFVLFGAHALRHRFAHRQLEAGADLSLLQAIMGHSSVKVTEGYLKMINLAKREAALNGAVGLPVTSLPLKL